MWDESDAKLYKVANFPNSDGEPFGLTIKGKGKHLEAHNKVMETINRLPKNKATSFGDSMLTVTDKVKTNTILNAKVTLTSAQNIEGQVELKIHKPSDKRHKATIEIRKLTGHTFDTVESVKDVITNMLDNFTAGENVSKLLIKAKGKATPYSPMKKHPSLAVKPLSCPECAFKVKSVVVLKNHIIKTHKPSNNKCHICGFEADTNDFKEHMDQLHLVHHSINIQNILKRKKSIIGCDKCGVTADTQKKMKEHKLLQHPVPEETSSASEPSPPRKKQVKPVEMKIVENAEVELMDIDNLESKQDNHMDVGNHDAAIKDTIIKAQEKTIKDQAEAIKALREDVTILHDVIEKKNTKVKVTPQIKPIPKFLSPVQDQHLKDLEGIRMKCNGNPGGDCLSSCTTMHLSFTKDKSERQRVNRRINNHIADNFDTYYCNKIALPYSETVGVGSKARQVTCSTREEFVSFLRSEDSMCAYANYQELLTIANMINIKIYVFTYGIGGDNKRWSWKVIHPDPVMACHSEFAQGTVPNMYLYNSDNTHYDLLVEDNSRLAVLGLISMGEEKEFEGKEFEEKKLPENQIQEKEFQENFEDNQHGGGKEGEQWKTVKHGKHITIPVNSVENTQAGKESEEIVPTNKSRVSSKRMVQKISLWFIKRKMSKWTLRLKWII